MSTQFINDKLTGRTITYPRAGTCAGAWPPSEMPHGEPVKTKTR